MGGYYDPAVQRRKLRPREGTWPWSHRGRKGWGQRGCRVHSGHCRGLAPAALSWASAHPSLTSSFYKHRPSQAPKGRRGKGRGLSLWLTPPVLGWKNLDPARGRGPSHVILLSSSPAPAWAAVPCVVREIPLLSLSACPHLPEPSLLPPCHGARSVQAWSLPMLPRTSHPVSQRCLEGTVSCPWVWVRRGAQVHPSSPLPARAVRGCVQSCLLHQDRCSWRVGRSKLLCVSQNPAPRPSLPCHLLGPSSVMGGPFGGENLSDPLHSRQRVTK